MNASGPRYTVQFRRRREGKTDYRKRKRLILSGRPRLVVRATNKNLVAQIVQAEIQGDIVLASAHSRQLPADWKASKGNLPSAYLTGLLLGRRAASKSIKRAVLDTGIRRLTKGSRISAALKGVLDADIEVPHDPAILPDEKRVAAAHIADYLGRLSSGPEKQRIIFSEYATKGIKPELITSFFEKVKGKILSEGVGAQ